MVIISKFYKWIKNYPCNIKKPLSRDIKLIGVIYWQENDMVFVRMKWPDFELVNAEYYVYKKKGKYISGQLAKTIGPLIVDAMHIPADVQLLVLPGHGLMHPTKRGLGVFIEKKWGIPTIGIAKKLLAGTPLAGTHYYRTRDGQRLMWKWIKINDEIVGGMALTRFFSRYLSSGGRVPLEELPVIFSTFVIGSVIFPLFIAKKYYTFVHLK